MKNAVGKTLIIPTSGLLKINRPAFTLKKIINTDGIKTLIIVLRAADQPTRKVHQIKTIPKIYIRKYVIKIL